MLLVALRAIRHERWASLHFYSVRGYVYTDKGKKQIWPPSAMSDSSQLWPRSSAAAGSCGIPLLGKHRHPAEGGSWSITTYPAACNSHPPCNWDIKTPWMDLSFIIREYITWASQILLVSSEGTLFPLETFPSCTSCSMYPLFLATLFSIKTVGSGTSFYLHLHTACSILRTLGSTVSVGAKELLIWLMWLLWAISSELFHVIICKSLFTAWYTWPKFCNTPVQETGEHAGFRYTKEMCSLSLKINNTGSKVPLSYLI